MFEASRANMKEMLHIPRRAPVIRGQFGFRVDWAGTALKVEESTPVETGKVSFRTSLKSDVLTWGGRAHTVAVKTNRITRRRHLNGVFIVFEPRPHFLNLSTTP